jgi:hypothetical protein
VHYLIMQGQHHHPNIIPCTCGCELAVQIHGKTSMDLVEISWRLTLFSCGEMHCNSARGYSLQIRTDAPGTMRASKHRRTPF